MATDPKTIPPAVFQKRAGGNYGERWAALQFTRLFDCTIYLMMIMAFA